MKLAQILYSGLGGHASVAFSLIDGLPPQAFEFSLGFLGIEPLVPAYETYCRGKGIRFQYFKAIAGKPVYTWPKVFFWLVKEKPDVLILHSVKTIIPCLLFRMFSRTPLVFVEHQPIQLRGKSDLFCSKIGMRFSSRVVCLSNDYAHDMKTMLGNSFDSKKVEIIPNGIDTKRFSPHKKDPIKSNRVVFGMAARFADTRRQDVLVETIENLFKVSPEIDWHLTLAGNGTTFDRVSGLIQEKGLSDKVTLAGHLDEVALIDWFHTLDIYVHATEGETLSTSMLQAMACGLPIVASNVPGVNNLLNREQNIGVLVDSQSSHAFSAAINNLVDCPARAKEVSENGRYVAEADFSKETMARRYSRLIDSLCKK